jgi:hypothetical protein
MPETGPETAPGITATLLAAVGALVLWLVLLLTLPPSGWLNVPLAVGVVLLVRWLALRTA